MGWLKAAVNWKFGQRLFYGHYLDAKYGNYKLSVIFVLGKFCWETEKSRRTIFLRDFKKHMENKSQFSFFSK